MEDRVEKFRQSSPERAKLRTQTSSNSQNQSSRKVVAVIYYLCRNQQLEHPHFMEVPLSSSNGLYLKDVVDRLSVLRGRRVALSYSWSCKRNGYVWHDLCRDDLILPAHGDEYVLKGSELLSESNSVRSIPAGGGVVIQNHKSSPEPPCTAISQESSRDDELSPTVRHPCSSTVSPDSSTGKNSSWNVSLSLTEYKLSKTDASTQTDEEIVVQGCSNDEITPAVERTPDKSRGCDNTGTLESLIRADVRKLKNLRMFENERCNKLKASTLIMQLISCGSISVKDHRFGLIPTYKPTLSSSKFPSPLFSTSFVLGEANGSAENRKLSEKHRRSFDTSARMLSEKEQHSTSRRETDFLRDNVEESNVITVEERLASGARVIIRTKKVQQD
ncbi:protein SOSEKI 3-like isoform X2 [Andrographis paniculata]|uniref:protein SOSEKI 3-like isoform X2 n=1 Tax=Andrographis paniculata TaxID=175694 RepID=UPI0021E961BD|nr:protein SOSEKI 3-like isoform X2 [Andrographis paniculata]